MKHLLILSILLLPVIAFSQKTYEYLSISQSGYSLLIVQGAESHEAINLRDGGKVDHTDFRPILKKVEQFEREGWTVFSTNEYQATYPVLHFMLRREKSE